MHQANVMTGFIAQIPPADLQAESIDNEPFYPSVLSADLRAIARFDGTVTADQLRHAAIAAITHVNDQLRDWMLTMQQGGYATMADVPAPQIAGTSTRLHAYQRAIAHAAMASIEDTRRAQATLPAGLNKGDRVLESVGLRQSDHWREMRYAVADVMARMRENIALI